MHLAFVFFLFSQSLAFQPAAPQPPNALPGEVTEIIVPKACVQRVECKGEWHLKNKVWSCPSLTVAFNCYRPKVEHRFSGAEHH